MNVINYGSAFWRHTCHTEGNFIQDFPKDKIYTGNAIHLSKCEGIHKAIEMGFTLSLCGTPKRIAA